MNIVVYCKTKYGLYSQEIEGTSEVFYTAAQLVSGSEVRCEIPFSIVDIEVRYTKITWLISVSSDNRTFSATKKVLVFDSKCLMCTGDDAASCQQKVCYTCCTICRK